MNKKYILTVLFLAAILLLGAGCVNNVSEVEQKNSDAELIMKDDVGMEEDAMDGDMMAEVGEVSNTDDVKELPNAPQKINFNGSVIAGSSAPLLDFNKTDYDKAVSSDKLIVLYFYANWCPICIEETANSLYPAFNELTTDKVVGFRVNYNDNQTDNDEKDLARKFGVAYQHTKVFVKDGQRVLKAPDSWNKQRYFNEINKFIN